MNIYLIILAVLVLGVLGFVLYKALHAPKEQAKNFADDHFRVDSLVESLRERVNAELNVDYTTLNIPVSEIRKREENRALLAKNTRECCLGDAGEREFVKETLKDWLQKYEGINSLTINKVIPFDRPDKMTAQDKFEYMYTLFKREYSTRVFDHMTKAFADAGWENFNKPDISATGEFFTEDDVEKAWEMLELEGGYNDQLETVVQRIYQKMYGHDVADNLISDESIDAVQAGTGGKTRVDFNYLAEIQAKDQEASDLDKVVMVNEIVFIIFHGRLIRVAFLAFDSYRTLERVTKNIYQYHTRVALSQKDPMLQSSLKNNSRVMVWRPPTCQSYGFIVRKFESVTASDIHSLFRDNGADDIITFMQMLVRSELNFVISGDPSCGKTTTLKALIKEIPDNYNIRTVETTFELDLNNLYPLKNVLAQQERGDYTVYDAITATKKLDTDVLILGELNEPRVASAYMQISQSGSKMCITTLHHESTRALIDYLVNALVIEIKDAKVAEKQILNVLYFDIHQAKDSNGHHYIDRITEVVPKEHKPYSKLIDTATREYYERSTDDQTFDTVDIFRFNRDTMTYEVVGMISERAKKKMRKVLGAEQTQMLLEMLERKKIPDTRAI
jgi:pilus assembly protein CpaF